MKNYYIEFADKCYSEIERLKTDYEIKINKSRNKLIAHNNYIKDIGKQHMKIQNEL